jgi:hypothetical protein
MRSKDWLTIEEARSRLEYRPETGALIWKKCRDSSKIGTQSKSLDVSVYVQVNIAGTVLKGHRLAWYLHYGAWPVGPIDHINGVRDDNRIENLREVDHKTNCQNVRLGSMRNKSTGFLGVYKNKNCKLKPYRAKIVSDGRQIHLGGYATPEEAHAAYVAAKRNLHAGCTI